MYAVSRKQPTLKNIKIGYDYKIKPKINQKYSEK